MIVVLSFDTFGDLLLRQPLFRALLDSGDRVAVAVRRGYERLLPFLDARLEAAVTDVHPYLPPDDTSWPEAEKLAAKLAALEPRIVVAATYNRTYLDEWLMGRVPAAGKIGFVNDVQPESVLDGVVGVGKAPRFEDLLSRRVAAPVDLPEVEKNRLLLREISGLDLSDYAPSLALPESLLEETAGLVRALGLETGRYVFGCPSAAGSTPLKVWPPEGYTELVEHLDRKHALPVLLTGVASEAGALQAIAAAGAERGVQVRQWIGSGDDLGRLLGLIRHSRLYLGNDSGPMHFAAALGIPIVALFGGGTWPRFLPRARRSYVATQAVPCSGCNWDCWLEEPLCLTRVEVERFREGIDWVLSGEGEENRVDLGRPLDAVADEIIRSGRSRSRRTIETIEADRAARLEYIHRLMGEQRESAEHLRSSEAQRQESEAQRQESEAQRQESEAQRQELVAVVQNLQETTGRLSAELEAVRAESALRGMQLQASESDRAARLEVIRGLERKIVEICSAKATAKRLAGIAARGTGLYRPLKACEAAVRRLLQGETVSAGGQTAAAIPTPALPRVRIEEEPASIHSRLVDAFVHARGMRSGIDDAALEMLYRFAASGPRILCLAPTAANVQAMYMLAKGGARVICLDASMRRSELEVYGIEAHDPSVGPWMISSRQTTLLHFDAVLLQADVDDETLRLLQGRFWPSTRVLVTGDGARRVRESWGEPDAMLGNVGEYRSAPSPWIDPAHRSPAIYDAADWPASALAIELPAALPSGRPWPRISVVTVTYNQAEYLEETLRSVLLQQYPNLEYIVLDGMSTDDTPAILERYRDRLAHCVRGKDEGQSDALNKGFARATGDIFAWLNSDDRYLPWTLWRVALAFDVYGSDVVAGGCAVARGRSAAAFEAHHNALPVGRVVPLPLERLLDVEGSWIKGDFFYQPEVFWTREAWSRSGGGVSEELFYSMDYELWVRMAQSGARIVHVPDTLAIYRMHEKQKTSGEELPYLPELLEVSARIRSGARRK